jgi:hypothetical protein
LEPFPDGAAAQRHSRKSCSEVKKLALGQSRSLSELDVEAFEESAHTHAKENTFRLDNTHRMTASVRRS